MPQLTFEVSEPLEADAVRAFCDRVTERYAAVMDTGTGHVGVSVRDGATLSLGRAPADAPVAVIDADIRAGRTAAQRRELATDLIAELQDRWAIPPEHVYVVYTEHPGEDFHLDEGALDSWSDDERSGDGPLAEGSSPSHE